MTLTPELMIAIEACLQSGRAILRHQRHLQPPGKRDDNAASYAVGLRSNELIINRLSMTGLPLMSELGRCVPYEERAGWERFWLVDPLEGELGFASGSGEYTVSIALIEFHEPVLGVVYAPLMDELYFASRETGAYHVREASSSTPSTIRLICASRSGRFNEARHFRLLVSPSHFDERTIRFIEELRQQYPEIDVMHNESALKLCMVAAGEADLYPRLDSSVEWETAAGHAIMKAVGKNIIDISSGHELIYNKPDMHNPSFIAK
jgi:3'(2'), 5'-bisphosphate nucleotidase